MALTKKDLKLIEATLVPGLVKALVPRLAPSLTDVLIPKLVPSLAVALVPKLEDVLTSTIEGGILSKVEKWIGDLRSEMVTNFDALFKKFEMQHEENILFRADMRSDDGRIN